MDFNEAHRWDVELAIHGDKYHTLPPLKPCRCGGKAILDISMALITCDRCEMSFEYRYHRGVIPYFTWQLVAEGGT